MLNSNKRNIFISLFFRKIYVFLQFYPGNPLKLLSFCDVLDRYEMRDGFYQKTYNQNTRNDTEKQEWKRSKAV